MGTVSDSAGTGIGTPYVYAELVMLGVRACAEAVRRGIGRARRRRELALLRAGRKRLEEALAGAGYAPSTAEQYARCTVRFVSAAGGGDPAELRDDDVTAYLADLREAGMSNATLRLHLCALRAVFDRMLDMGLTGGIVHAPRPCPRAEAAPGQVQRLCAACCCDRDRLAIEMLNRTGVMPGKLPRYGLEEGALLSAVSADGSGRPAAAVESREYPADRPGILWLFPSPVRPGPISARTLRRIVARAAAACGLRITCTAIRKADPVPLRTAG